METTLKVEGMTCGHCKSAVEGALKEVDGVNEVNVNLETGQVKVSHADSANKVEMREVVEEQGYDVV
ncbi:cation transporter [Halobacillus karajensis]|uniref:Copper chaperone CopZ n=1 Tax=Halobacillus karajensis TaxID=195088 RepID=A0A024P285_9BACI|nr:cation transporter [Halobacillus karajensis]CDQ19929.1 Copper chaperone CopZ [Halobacillus karajensis]CDQ22389.1 Copper chaperone CopZ [Halobacillus karajensis]CDQ28232.1 Copper chaperone CopZ [Halobacillus karajensis]